MERWGVDDGVIGNAHELSELDRLYRDEYSGLVRLAFSLTSDDQLAQEIIQEAFLKLHQVGGHVQNPIAYLRTIVVNGCRSHHRHQAVVRRVPPERAPIANADYDELFDAVKRLPWRQQAVLALRFQLDLPEDEIASVLDCRPGTVRSLVFRALATLRQEIPR